MKNRIFSLLLLLTLCAFLVLPCAAAGTDEAHPPRVWDDAGLLTDGEYTALTQKLDEISERLDFDVVVVTVFSLDGADARAYADDVFDLNGYGMGDGGILFLFAPNDGENGKYHFSTFAKGEDIFDGDAFDELESATLDLLRAGRYAEAFDAYADTCDALVGSYGKISAGTVIFALLAGVVLAFLIPMNLYKGQLKSVRSQPAATDYVRSGSMQLTVNRDLFLYRNITRTPKPKNNSSGNGSHTSSSGSSHGGRGGSL